MMLRWLLVVYVSVADIWRVRIVLFGPSSAFSLALFEWWGQPSHTRGTADERAWRVNVLIRLDHLNVLLCSLVICRVRIVMLSIHLGKWLLYPHLFTSLVLVLLISVLGRATSRIFGLKVLIVLILVFERSVAHQYSFVSVGDVSSQFFYGNSGRVELRALNNLLLLLLCKGQIGSRLLLVRL